MIERNYVPGGKIETLVKDLRLGVACPRGGARAAASRSAAALLRTLVERGDGELDCAAIVEPLRQRSLREKAQHGQRAADERPGRRAPRPRAAAAPAGRRRTGRGGSRAR